MNYLDLQTQFLALLNRRDCTTAQAKAFIQAAIQRIQTELRTPILEKTVNITVGAPPWTGLAIPADFLELINIVPTSTSGGTVVTDYKRLEKADISAAMVGALTVGLPRQYCRHVNVWVLAPAPSQNDVLQLDYYATFATLSADGDTNTLSLSSPYTIIYAALSYAGDFFVDTRRDDWENRYLQLYGQLDNQADNDEMQGASVVVPAWHYPDDLNSDGSNIVSIGY